MLYDHLRCFDTNRKEHSRRGLNPAIDLTVPQRQVLLDEEQEKFFPVIGDHHIW